MINLGCPISFACELFSNFPPASGPRESKQMSIFHRVETALTIEWGSLAQDELWRCASLLCAFLLLGKDSEQASAYSIGADFLDSVRAGIT